MTYRAAFTYLRGHLGAERAALVRAAGWATIEALPAFSSGLLVAAALDRGFLAGRALEGLAWLAALGAASALAAFATWRMYPLLGRAVETTRDGLLRDVVTGSLVVAVRTQGTAGASVAQVTEQVETVRNLLGALLRSLRQLLTPLVATLAGLTLMAPVLAAVVAIPALLALAIYIRAARGLLARERAVVEAREAVASAAATVFDGVRDVVVCAAEERASATVAGPIEQEASTTRALARANTLRTLVVALGSGVPTIAVLAASSWLLPRHLVSVGDVAGAVMYVSSGLRMTFSAIVSQGGAWVMELAVTLVRLASVGTLEQPAIAGNRPATAGADLVLDSVRFAYSTTAEPVIERLSARILAETHLVVVGPSGAGKSTLAGLLAGLLEPDAGGVELGGVPVREIHRTGIALVPQEAYVFTGTVRENVTYLRTDATRAATRDAVAAVGAEPLVARLGGLDAELEPGGGGLSAGERQLLALARTYLSPARVVILDEATCHLDPSAEARAELAFRRRPGTLIVIAHRMSSALRADRILVLDGTQAILAGHDELLTGCGLYADLVGHWNVEKDVRLPRA
jgi:ABC-type multidrug transport system fused ATPase/permease subunit